MFLPIGDSPNLPKIPWVTWTLIAANVAIHLALWPLDWVAAQPTDPEYFAYLQVLSREHGIRPMVVRASDLVHYRYGSKPREPSPFDALTAMFLHSGWLHLVGNMLFLWIFGDNVEHRLGRFRFLLAYLGTGFAAALGDLVLRWGSGIPSVGASGAISGVLGFYFAWFPHNRVRVWVFLFPFYIGTLELSARIVLGIYLVVDNILPLLLTGGGGGISYGAHIGGFLAGWGLARWLAVRPAVPRREGVTEPDTLQQTFREALDGGRLQEATSILFDLPRRQTLRALNVHDKIALGRALESRRQARPALAAYQRALADHPASPDCSQAHLGAARVLIRNLGSPTAAYQHLYAVMEEAPTAEELDEARSLLADLQHGTRSIPRQPWG